MIKIIWLPAILEVVNVVAHRFMRPEAETFHWSDGVSFAITAGLVCFAAWSVATVLRRVGTAIWGGLLIWLLSVLFVLVLMGADRVFNIGSFDALVTKGYLVSVVVTTPIFAVLATVTSFIANRRRGHAA